MNRQSKRAFLRAFCGAIRTHRSCGSRREVEKCERSETITSVRNVPERNERGRRADADRVKHRLSVATFQNDEQGNCCPSGNRYQRQTDGSRIANERDWQKWWRLAGLVRNVRPSKGVTRTVTPCRMLTNANVENIMGVANRYPPCH